MYCTVLSLAAGLHIMKYNINIICSENEDGFIISLADISDVQLANNLLFLNGSFYWLDSQVSLLRVICSF